MLFVRPAPLNSGSLAVLIIPSVQAPSRAAGSFFGPSRSFCQFASNCDPLFASNVDPFGAWDLGLSM